ncbi:MAG: hypothetical protein ACK5LP_07175 [Campylobacteraceae bacterium]
MSETWKRAPRASEYLGITRNALHVRFLKAKQSGKNTDRWVKRDGKQLYFNVSFLEDRTSAENCSITEFSNLREDIYALLDSGMLNKDMESKIGIRKNLLPHLLGWKSVKEKSYKRYRKVVDELLKTINKER